jgi:hypothetical protein
MYLDGNMEQMDHSMDQSTAEAESHADSSCSQKETNRSDQSMASNDSSSSAESEDKNQLDGKAKLPPASLESLPQQYEQRSTTNTASSTASKNSAGTSSRLSMLSTSSARFMELEARIDRQKKELARKDQISSDRLIVRIEHQFKRLDEMEGKIDSLSSDLETKLDETQTAQTQRFDIMDDKIFKVMKMQAGFGDSINALSDRINKLLTVIEDQKLAQRLEEHISQDSTLLASLAPSSTLTVWCNDSARIHDRQPSILDQDKSPSPLKKKQRPSSNDDSDSNSDDQKEVESAMDHEDMQVEEMETITDPGRGGVEETKDDAYNDESATDPESQYNNQSSLGGEPSQ